MRHQRKLAAVALGLLAGAASAQTSTQLPAAAPPELTIMTVQPARSEAMQELMNAAQQLRDSIHLLAQQPPGAQRNVAIAEAQQALLRTQQAMANLPPELRRGTAPRAAAGDEASVQALMEAADALRESIQAMARAPAGERRDQAIRDANRALLDTQVAMVNAHDATVLRPDTTVLGASRARPGIRCVWLGDMWGCT